MSLSVAIAPRSVRNYSRALPDPVPDAAGWLQIVGIIPDKRDDVLRKPVLPEAFLPYTLSMRMFTQVLVRSDVPSLSLLHAVAAQVNSVDPDQQIYGEVHDLEHWITDLQE